MVELNTSVHVDSELWREDIEGSIAHVRGLEAAGVVTKDEAAKLPRLVRIFSPSLTGVTSRGY